MTTEVFLGIGGNLGSRISNIEKTVKLISEKIAEPQKISSIYISEPWGFKHSKYFTNAVVRLETDLTPGRLLLAIKEIEAEMKRIKTKGVYEGRTMDIDILFYGDKVFSETHLQVPHEKLQDRLFVLLPLNEIAPDLEHPVLKKSITRLLENCNDKSKIKKLCYEPRKIHEAGNS